MTLNNIEHLIVPNFYSSPCSVNKVDELYLEEHTQTLNDVEQQLIYHRSSIASNKRYIGQNRTHGLLVPCYPPSTNTVKEAIKSRNLLDSSSGTKENLTDLIILLNDWRRGYLKRKAIRERIKFIRELQKEIKALEIKKSLLIQKSIYFNMTANTAALPLHVTVDKLNAAFQKLPISLVCNGLYSYTNDSQQIIMLYDLTIGEHVIRPDKRGIQTDYSDYGWDQTSLKDFNKYGIKRPALRFIFEVSPKINNLLKTGINIRPLITEEFLLDPDMFRKDHRYTGPRDRVSQILKGLLSWDVYNRDSFRPEDVEEGTEQFECTIHPHIKGHVNLQFIKEAWSMDLVWYYDYNKVSSFLTKFNTCFGSYRVPILTPLLEGRYKIFGFHLTNFFQNCYLSDMYGRTVLNMFSPDEIDIPQDVLDERNRDSEILETSSGPEW